MRRRFTLLLLFILFLPACTGNLWGSYDAYLTPTPSMTPSVTPSQTITPTNTPEATLTPTATPTIEFTSTESGSTANPETTVFYISEPGDSLEAVAARFGVQPEEITSSSPIPENGLFSPGTPLVIPARLAGIILSPSAQLLPDSELVYSPTSIGFDADAYVTAAGGELASYQEYLLLTGWTYGGGSVAQVAQETSTNPRLLLALVQYFTGWVQGEPLLGVDEQYPLGYETPKGIGLHRQMRLAVEDLAAGYYGWREGTLTELTFTDGSTLRLAPDLNAGTVALYYFFALRTTRADWLKVVDPQTGFIALYTGMFGDPWERASRAGDLIPQYFVQPDFSLPFETDVLWSYTGGPHDAWEEGSALAALDFAPATGESGCSISPAWALAVAPGVVVRSGGGYVILDLDGDGYEQTGWVVLYLHIAAKDRVPAGTWLDAGDRIGHPSCEGGIATGNHIHMARKYNGEWIGAGGAVPFVLSGWTAHYGDAPYLGTLTRNGETVTASSKGSIGSVFTRQPGE